ncbi:hypothetical protein [Spiroplasma tabanidicola]|uniref:Uncharacterized protein n=1 Tax=Spiroplasma tabanidicola TaxID=324079 RepID=A0A6I6CAP3_9MOLU|nr:hypothetical protein [Spiroplasma tabanidicola]QGS51985.1 hypothetical protein STABA_v1c06240 [Spiroplasma tabanidicola]
MTTEETKKEIIEWLKANYQVFIEDSDLSDLIISISNDGMTMKNLAQYLLT